MRMALVCLVAIGCGGGEGGSGFDPDLLVTELETGDQVALCEHFIEHICESGDPLFDSFCADECKTTNCAAAASGGNIDEECAAIEVGEVDDCAEAADMATCVQGGGCMFDAVEASCE